MSDNGQPVLRAERVHEVFQACLFREGEDASRSLATEGIVHNVAFHAERLEELRPVVIALLGELPADFMESAGGGTTFLNACVDKQGRQWGEHVNMEQLILLGLALQAVELPLPREVWPLLPGGLPYVTVKL